MREIQKIEKSFSHSKKRVAAYARVSEKSERLMNSLSAQVGYYRDYIQKNPDWIFAGIYADRGISGTSAEKRGEFKRMIKDCEAGKIDIILVKSISRFARNTVDLLEAVRHLKDIGVEVIFEKENISSADASGELMLTILASFAQEESRSISENVKWGTRKRFLHGIPNGKVRVFGYAWQNGDLVVVPDEEKIIKRIFNGFLDGKSPRLVAAELNNEGITTRAGCAWSDYAIRTILKNVTYTGNMLLQKSFTADPISKRRKENRGELPQYLVKNSHEPIIDEDTFNRAQAEFSRRARKKANTPNN